MAGKKKAAQGAGALAHAEIAERLRGGLVLASTVGLDGSPQLRSARFMFEEGGALYFETLKSSRFYAELSAEPRIALLVMPAGEGGTALRISAKVCFTEEPEITGRCSPELTGEGRKALIAFFLLNTRAEELQILQTGGPALCEESLKSAFLPDPEGVLVGIRIKKDKELKERIEKILARREEQGADPALSADEAKLLDGALFVFAEAAKALWPRMNIMPIERAALFETYDEREEYTRRAARLIGNAVIDKPEDITYYTSIETLKELEGR